jgi:hypothetical protein
MAIRKKIQEHPQCSNAYMRTCAHAQRNHSLRSGSVAANFDYKADLILAAVEYRIPVKSKLHHDHKIIYNSFDFRW